MKMVRSLLLGSAAGLVALAGAQAADLPVKAKPVEYVKVCSLYGVGFYYIPGTDTCIKIGGYARADYYWDSPGAFPKGFNPAVGAQPLSIVDANLRPHQTLDWRARFDFSMDVRSQTSYGVLRSYVLAGFDNTNGAVTPRLTRAFIQFAGFTFGLAAVSFFDGFSPCGLMSNIVSWSCNGQGATGWLVAAYTAQLGNGVSLSLSLEYPRNGGVIDLLAAANGAADTAGNRVPDFVANVRVDQAWGYVMIAAALHRVAGNYYGANVVTNGGPADRWGWAIQGSVFLNLPSPSTQVGVGFYYGEGAVQYVQTGAFSGFYYYPGGLPGGTISYGVTSDGVFATPGALAVGNTGAIQLTRSWAIVAGLQHRWNPQWMTSLFGGYTRIDYNPLASAMICALAPTTLSGGVTTSVGACNPDFGTWSIGSRTVWTPVQNLSFALDVVYHTLQTSNAGALNSVVPPVAGLGTAGGLVNTADQSFWTWMFRVQRSFWP